MSTRRAASLLHRGLSHMQRRGEQQLARPEAPRTLKEYDEEKYGGWKSAKMLFAEEQQRKSLIGRLDWHIVQFLLAMIPSGIALLLVQWARYDMARTEQEREQEALEKESAKMALVLKHQQETGEKAAPSGKQAAAAVEAAAAAAAAQEAAGTGTPAATPAASQQAQAVAGAGGADMQQRLNRVESLLAELQAQLAATAAAGKGSLQQTQQQLPAVQQKQQHVVGTGSQVEQQPAEERQQQQQQQQAQPRSLYQRLASGWQWLRGPAAAGTHQEPPDTAPGAAGGGSEARSSLGSVASAGSEGAVAEGHVPAAAQQPVQQAAHQQPADRQQAVQQADRQQAASPPTAAAGTPSTAAPFGNTANRLLHAMGQPLRWLRQQADGSPRES